MGNNFIGAYDDPQDNPYGSRELNPDIINGVNQIIRDVDSVTNGIKNSIKRNAARVLAKVNEVTDALPPLVIGYDSGNQCQPDDCLIFSFEWKMPETIPSGFPNFKTTEIGDGWYSVLIDVPQPQNTQILTLYSNLGEIRNIKKKCVPCIAIGINGENNDNNTNLGDDAIIHNGGGDSNSDTYCNPPPIDITCPPPIVQCPNPIVNNIIKCPEIKPPDIIVKLGEINVKCNQPAIEVSCKPPDVQVINKITVECPKDDKKDKDCNKECEKAETAEEKEKCLDDCLGREPNWLRFLISKDGQKKMKAYGEEMGFTPPFMTGGPIFTDIIAFANATQALLTSNKPLPTFIPK